MMLKTLHAKICDLIFPPRCPVCDRPMSSDDRKKGVCAECRGLLKPVREPRCMKCGAQLKDDETEYCRSCKGRRHYYDRGLAMYEYASVRSSVYRLKYSGRVEYAEFFGREMARRLGPAIKQWGAEALIPVPLHASRQRRRGYNQAAAIARFCGRALGLPVREDLIRRAVKTRPMKLLNAKERQINLKNAFIMRTDVVKLGTVVIVDDIYTTGATIDAMARLLKASGVRKVYFVTLAIGSGV